MFLLSKIVLCCTFLKHGIFGGIVNRTIFSNVQNSDKVISCHHIDIRKGNGLATLFNIIHDLRFSYFE